MAPSIIRRSSVILAFLLPGFVLNFGLMYVATRILDVATFGIFYSANSLIAILTAPSMIVGLFVARHFARLHVSEGRDAVIAAYRTYVAGTAKWIGGTGLVMLPVFLALGHFAGVRSIQVIILVVLVSAIYYLTESVRSALQGLRAFIALGAIGLGWMVSRFAATVALIYFIGTAWSGLVGFAIAGVLVFAVGYKLVVGAAPPGRAGLDLRSMPPFVVSYGILSGLFYLDVIQAYFYLDPTTLGTYAASSILPKALLVVSSPVSQVFFPVAIGHVAVETRTIFMKSLAYTILIGIGGAAVLAVPTDAVCGGTFGIKDCNGEIMTWLGAGTAMMCILRVLVLSQLARGRDLHPLLILVPTIPYVTYVHVTPPGASGLALAFAVYGAGMLAFYAAAIAVTNIGARRAAYS